MSRGKGESVVFVKQEMQYRVLGKAIELEYLAVEIWTREGNLKKDNYYNPCKKKSMEISGELSEDLEEKVIRCGGFNSQSTLWG